VRNKTPKVSKNHGTKTLRAGMVGLDLINSSTFWEGMGMPSLNMKRHYP